LADRQLYASFFYVTLFQHCCRPGRSSLASCRLLVEDFEGLKAGAPAACRLLVWDFEVLEAGESPALRPLLAEDFEVLKAGGTPALRLLRLLRRLSSLVGETLFSVECVEVLGFDEVKPGLLEFFQ
jgi:hypothetical protein